VERLVPYLLSVMALPEAEPARRPVQDHFSFRQQDPAPVPTLDDALIRGTATALRKLVAQDPGAAQSTLHLLAADPHDSAQRLLYEALRADSARYADQAAELLLEGSYRFRSGYLSNGYLAVRQLLEATTPHMAHGHFADLETTILAPGGTARMSGSRFDGPGIDIERAVQVGVRPPLMDQDHAGLDQSR